MDTIEKASCEDLIKGQGDWNILSVRIQGVTKLFTPINDHEILIISGHPTTEISILDSKSDSSVKKVATTQFHLLSTSN